MKQADDYIKASPHISVLLQQVLANMPENNSGTFIDVTLGYGGHSAALLEKMAAGSRLIGMDKDETALAYAKELLAPLAAAKKIEFLTFKEDFINFGKWYELHPYTDIRLILADVGVSSPQLDQAERGFSYKQAGPLDMRMDKSAALDCEQLLASIDERQLSDIIYQYGEERYARQIAQAIVQARKKARIKNTLHLAEIIRSAMPKQAWREKQDPARRTFQALRIAVNNELAALENLLAAAIEAVAPQGRIEIISFHSLEDRIVKQQFNRWHKPCKCLPDLPCQCGLKSRGKVIGKQGFVADAIENAANFRAHSARLRVFEKTN